MFLNWLSFIIFFFHFFFHSSIWSTAKRSSSSPFSRHVSANPLSALQRGQHLSWAPSYQRSTHGWQPIRYRQHLLKIIGGFMGDIWQMWQVKHSKSRFRIPIGSFICLFTSKREVIFALTSFRIFSAFGFFGWGSSSSDESLIIVSIFLFRDAKSLLLIAKMFRLPTFQNFSPV